MEFDLGGVYSITSIFIKLPGEVDELKCNDSGSPEDCIIDI